MTLSTVYACYAGCTEPRKPVYSRSPKPKRGIMRHVLILAALTLATGVHVNARAQQAGPATQTPSAQDYTSAVNIPVGENLRVAIEKGFRIKGINQPVTGRVVSAVFMGKREVIPSGSVVRGHITSLSSAGSKVRFGRLLNGDLTPPKVVSVTFDELIMNGDKFVPLQTDECWQMPSTKLFLYQAKHDRPNLKMQARSQVLSVVQTPNKLQKLSEGLVTSLPLHPEFIDEGTIFNSRLVSDLNFPTEDIPTILGASSSNDGYLQVRLLTPLDSDATHRSQRIEAVVSAPLYDGKKNLIYAPGLILSGTVVKAKPSGWFQKQGLLKFQFTSISNTDAEPQRLYARVIGVEAAKSEALSIDSEGAMKATYSPIKMIASSLSLLGPSRGLADSSLDKTAFQRGGQGRKGIGLIGTGAAQASASAAVGFGYYGAAKKLYGTFIAKGSEVSLPADTRILLDTNR